MNLSGSLGTSKLMHRSDFVPIEPMSNVAALPPAPCKNATKHIGSGYPTLVTYARFVAWAIEQTAFPNCDQVTARFGTCKATSHRWLNALEEAYGVERPRLVRGARRRK